MVRMLTDTARGAARWDADTGWRCRARAAHGRRARAWRVARLRCLGLALAAALLGGCATPYVMQAAEGEWHVLHERVPIAKVLADPHTAPQLRAHLEQVRAAREFASRELGLPDNDAYRSYADIGRPYVVWNVVATAEFSVKPEHWCFPVAGCVAYRGYFSEQRAHDFALGLETRGLDVVVDGVPAYSTLGKFADPVLSSMLRYGDDELAATIFHELAHQLLYVRDDSEFNEAFATTVATVGLARWLAHQGQEQRMQAFRTDQAHEQVLVALLAGTRARLAQLYATPLPPGELRARKATAFAALAADLRSLGQPGGGGEPLYEEWLAAGLNNARLASVATYYDCVPGFNRLLQQASNDLPRFYTAARELAQRPRSERHALLCTSASAATD
jgi:predicted aminopeptidase